MLITRGLSLITREGSSSCLCTDDKSEGEWKSEWETECEFKLNVRSVFSSLLSCSYDCIDWLSIARLSAFTFLWIWCLSGWTSATISFSVCLSIMSTFPASRVKKIMKEDTEIISCGNDAVAMVSIAAVLSCLTSGEIHRIIRWPR
jgi:hypothetical protein